MFFRALGDANSPIWKSSTNIKNDCWSDLSFQKIILLVSKHMNCFKES